MNKAVKGLQLDKVEGLRLPNMLLFTFPTRSVRLPHVALSSCRLGQGQDMLTFVWLEGGVDGFARARLHAYLKGGIVDLGNMLDDFVSMAW